MESTFLSIKYLIFIGLLVVVVSSVAIVLIAAAYQVVRDKVRETHRRDGVAPDAPPATAPRHS